MNAPARPARMERNATTGPMASSAAVLKVRAPVPKRYLRIVVRMCTAPQVFRQTNKPFVALCLVYVRCSVFWGVSSFPGCLLAKQTDLRPLIPLFPSLALRIMGSLRTSSCQEKSLGHHPDICSSVKPPHTSSCCPLSFIPLP